MKPETTTEYDTDDILKRFEKLTEPKPIDIDQVKLVALPKGLELHDTKRFRDALRERPERRAGVAMFTTLTSFCEHAIRFKDDHSAIFADDNPKNPKLVSVLDYHEKTADGRPRFGTHRGVYAFPVSEEWKAWHALHEKPLDQKAFAEMLETRIFDVIDPANVGQVTREAVEAAGITLAGPSRLMTIAKGLSIRVDSKIVNAVNLSSGETQLTYEEVHRGQDNNSPVNVPGGFVIGIPVFRSGELFQIVVRLRYRASAGSIAWWVQLHRADVIFEHAFREACTEAEGLTELPLFFGTPE